MRTPLRGLTACVVVALAAACGSTDSGASAEDARVLDRIADAERTLAYVGWKRTLFGPEGEGRATRMRVARAASGPRVFEWAPEGTPRGRWAFAEERGWLADPRLLLRNYRLTLDDSPGPSVAWRETRRVRLEARAPGRPSLDLLVDAQTWLVLREEIRGFDGAPWLTHVFDAIEYRAPEPAEVPDDAEPLAEAPCGPSGRAPLAVTAPPAGFVRAAASRLPDGGFREDWTDGLAAFCILQKDVPEAGQGAEGRLERRSLGGRASVSGVLSRVAITVSGNVAAGELEAVVRGLAATR